MENIATRLNSNSVQYAANIPATGNVEAPSGVTTATNTLEHYAEALADTVVRLEERLGRVLWPSAPMHGETKDCASEPQAPPCPLASELFSIASRLEEADRRGKALLERLAI